MERVVNKPAGRMSADALRLRRRKRETAQVTRGTSCEPLRPIEELLWEAVVAGNPFVADERTFLAHGPHRVRARVLQAAIKSAPNGAAVQIDGIEVEGAFILQGMSLAMLAFVDCLFEASLELHDLEVGGPLIITGTRLTSMQLPPSLSIEPLADDTTWMRLVGCTCRRLELRNCRMGQLDISHVKAFDRCELKALELLYSFHSCLIADSEFGDLLLGGGSAGSLVIENSRCKSLSAEPIGIEEFELKEFDVEQCATVEGARLRQVFWHGGQVGGSVRVAPDEIDALELQFKVGDGLTCESRRIGRLRVGGTEVGGLLAVRASKVDQMMFDRVGAEAMSVGPTEIGEVALGTVSLSRVTLRKNLSISKVVLSGDMLLERVSVAEKAVFSDWRASPDPQRRGLLRFVRCEADHFRFVAGTAGRGGPGACWLRGCKVGTIKWGWGVHTRADLGDSVYHELILGGSVRRQDRTTERLAFLERGQQLPETYLALAASLAARGLQDEADDVRYALRRLDIQQARREGSPWRASLLWMLDITMGFGIGLRSFRCLWLLCILVLLGAAVIEYFGPSAGRYDVSWAVGASLHRLLPIVNLSPRYAEFFKDLPQENTLNYFQNAYFCLHSALGWLLGSFLIAGLAGLTQKRS